MSKPRSFAADCDSIGPVVTGPVYTLAQAHTGVKKKAHGNRVRRAMVEADSIACHDTGK
jgi:hypothetical protein